jgi:hypothetical protein
VDRFRAVSVSYQMRWDFDDAYASYLELYGLYDCTVDYAAEATFVERTDLRAQFSGSWDVVETDCGGGLEDVIWTNPGRTTYASFWFNADGTRLDDWLEHADPTKDEPLEEPSRNKQYYITEMDTPFDGTSGTAAYNLEESFTVDIIPVVLTHDVLFAFTE